MVLWALDREPDNGKRRKKYLVLSASSHITHRQAHHDAWHMQKAIDKRKKLFTGYISNSIDINL